MTTTKRRPIKSRSNPLIRRFAHFLSRKAITPNQISLLSIPFATIGMLALALWATPQAIWIRITLLLLAILCIQGRLLCNLFDGMVAMEGGKTTPDGELYNDAPDRLTDSLLLIGLGIGVHEPFGLYLGLAAALLAITTAYIRTLGVSIGAPAFFNGPMAKPHRMALLTVALFATGISHLFDFTSSIILYIGLIIIIIGSILTCINRLRLIRQYLSHRHA